MRLSLAMRERELRLSLAMRERGFLFVSEVRRGNLRFTTAVWRGNFEGAIHVVAGASQLSKPNPTPFLLPLGEGARRADEGMLM